MEEGGGCAGLPSTGLGWLFLLQGLRQSETPSGVGALKVLHEPLPTHEPAARRPIRPGQEQRPSFLPQQDLYARHQPNQHQTGRGASEKTHPG